MIVLVAKYYLRSAEDMPAVLEAVDEMAERVRLEEPSCVLYQASRSAEREDLVLLYEHYVDEGAMLAHRETPHFKDVIERRIVPLLAQREREVYELVVS